VAAGAGHPAAARQDQLRPPGRQRAGESQRDGSGGVQVRAVDAEFGAQVTERAPAGGTDEAVVVERAERRPCPGVLQRADLHQLAEHAAAGQVEVGVDQLLAQRDPLGQQPGERLGQEPGRRHSEAATAGGPAHLVIDGEDIGQVEGVVVTHG
jgi:hypothetical protein